MVDTRITAMLRNYFPPELQEEVLSCIDVFADLQEIRCRVGKPVFLCFVQHRERQTTSAILQEQMQYIVSRITQGSIYAWEEELRRGYLTLPGGFRVGLVGKAVLENGHIRTLKQISSMNFRIARAVPGAADSLMPFLYEQQIVQNCLIVSPPGGGKTTILRDMVRQLSNGVPSLLQPGRIVGVVDERSELAGSVNGIAQMDVGCRTDVLDGCPKSDGIPMMIRAMAPQVIAVDEIGTDRDVQALQEATQSGVAVLATAHGSTMTGLRHHPVLNKLVATQYFSRIVFLHWRGDQITMELYRKVEGAGYETIGCDIDSGGRQCDGVSESL